MRGGGERPRGARTGLAQAHHFDDCPNCTRCPADAALSSLRSYGSGVWLLAGRLLKRHATLVVAYAGDWIPGVKPVATGMWLTTGAV